MTHITKKIITGYVLSLGVAIIVLAGVINVQASEVTGTLSSDSSSIPQITGTIGGTVTGVPQTTGTIGGTVTSVSSGGGGGGGSSGGGLSNIAPTGSVLGVSTFRETTPGFPNTGYAPEVSSFDQFSWSTIMSFLKNVLSL